MESIVVVCNSEDKKIVQKLVSFLKKFATTWWFREKRKEIWDSIVKDKIKSADIVIAFLSENFTGNRQDILRDEMDFAKKHDKGPIIFRNGDVDIPFGLNRTDQISEGLWDGTEEHPAFQSLRQRVQTILGIENPGGTGHIMIDKNKLYLPEFVFSLSSHETQLAPSDGLVVHPLFNPAATLISAYDVYHLKLSQKEKNKFHSNVKRASKAGTIIFLDSGNYEAKRKGDYYSESNRGGWSQEKFWEIANSVHADLIFSYDNYPIPRDLRKLKKEILKSYYADKSRLAGKINCICPIVHLPSSTSIPLGEYAAKLIQEVAVETSPKLIAIPERELGDGLMERARNVRLIRTYLDKTGSFYPLHLLGTGNPISIAVLAAAGANTFDGLEWCRTVINYGTATLFHFQHLEFFDDVHAHRITDPTIKELVLNKSNNYSVRAILYNANAFQDWMNDVREYIKSNNASQLLKMVATLTGNGLKQKNFEDIVK